MIRDFFLRRMRRAGMSGRYPHPVLGQQTVRLPDGRTLEVVRWRVAREKRPVWVRTLKDPLDGSGLLAIGYDRGCAPIYHLPTRNAPLIGSKLVWPNDLRDAVEREERLTVGWVLSMWGEPPPWFNPEVDWFPYWRPARSSINPDDQRVSGGFIRELPADTAYVLPGIVS